CIFAIFGPESLSSFFWPKRTLAPFDLGSKGGAQRCNQHRQAPTQTPSTEDGAHVPEHTRKGGRLPRPDSTTLTLHRRRLATFRTARARTKAASHPSCHQRLGYGTASPERRAGRRYRFGTERARVSAAG